MSTTNPIYREGAVGVGLSTSPLAQLHVKQDIVNALPGQEVGIIPIFRMHRAYNTGSFNGDYVWDLYSDEGLSFVAGDGTTGYLGLRIYTDQGLKVPGDKLELGFGGGNKLMGMGYSNNLQSHFITFNGTFGDGTTWQGTGGKVVLHSDSDGNFYILTAPSTGYIGPSQNRRLTITPTGTAIIGDGEDEQNLTISSNRESILRFQRKGTGPDFEILRNDDGDLEFRGGQDGVGAALPSLMKLRKDGKLVIGTDDSPNSIDAGITDISGFKLYVEGGILTKEVRVRTIWSDYVFEKNYSLLPLPQVKTHIETHDHLHNTPSGASIEKDGLELGSMMANQQEKIEEIYLHLIEMNEKLSSLEEENKALKAQVKQLEKKN